jgi:hypothetical protein
MMSSNSIVLHSLYIPTQVPFFSTEVENENVPCCKRISVIDFYSIFLKNLIVERL